jgi:hypothetical protein
MKFRGNTMNDIKTETGDDGSNNSSIVSLRVSETDPKFVGRGIALVDLN